MTARSLAALAGKYDAVNIKLDKTGGLTEALAMAQEAERLGFALMVGCMVATSLVHGAGHAGGAARARGRSRRARCCWRRTARTAYATTAASFIRPRRRCGADAHSLKSSFRGDAQRRARNP